GHPLWILDFLAGHERIGEGKESTAVFAAQELALAAAGGGSEQLHVRPVQCSGGGTQQGGGPGLVAVTGGQGGAEDLRERPAPGRFFFFQTAGVLGNLAQ